MVNQIPTNINNNINHFDYRSDANVHSFRRLFVTKTYIQPNLQYNLKLQEIYSGFIQNKNISSV